VDDERFDGLTRVLTAGLSPGQGISVVAGASTSLIALVRPTATGADCGG
jgi:hypothetical protein